MPINSQNRPDRLLVRLGTAVSLAACAILIQIPAAIAQPESTITVKADQATLVALEGEPATVVIGNALFADITLKKGMIFIHGRHYGTTNVIVLDKENAELASFELHVVRGGSQNVTITKGSSAYSYLCAPACQGSLQVGDNAEYFGSISAGISTKQQLSTSVNGLTE